MNRRFALFLAMSIAIAAVPELAELNRMIGRFAPAELRVDTSAALSPGDRPERGTG